MLVKAVLRWYHLYKGVYRMTEKVHTKEQFQQDLYALGLRAGDTVMMHSAFKSLGGIEGGAQVVFSALFELLGPEGTLILPAFSYNSVNEENPCFNVHTTPSCVGYLAEYFRTSVPGVIRSLHATHSCCMKGKQAQALAADHQLDLTPVGKYSPMTKLPAMNGKILILGSHPDNNTALHGVEEAACAPYIFDPAQRINYVLQDGTQTIEQHAWRHYFVREGYHYQQKYDRIIPLLSSEEYTCSQVLDATCYLFSAKAVWEKGITKLKEDPYYFVNRIEDPV